MTEDTVFGRVGPVRVCCGQRHHGPVCPDGLVMCCMCFKRVPTERLHILESGGGSELATAPIYEDVCLTCKKREDRWDAARAGGQSPQRGKYVQP